MDHPRAAVPNETNKVDVKLKLEEQNRNQLTFGAGVSEFEGVFGQLSFQTANFLGRGESLTLSMSAGSRAQNYSLAFSEPFLFETRVFAIPGPARASLPGATSLAGAVAMIPSGPTPFVTQLWSAWSVS